MATCPACGFENPEAAKFCSECGARLAAAPAASERRKLATLLFCDVSGSTAMGERLDAESVRELMFRYFHEMRGAIERHGGTVEKFVGDAVLAAFGVPVAREDDALRAVRAAARDARPARRAERGARGALRLAPGPADRRQHGRGRGRRRLLTGDVRDGRCRQHRRPTGAGGEAGRDPARRAGPRADRPRRPGRAGRAGSGEGRGRARPRLPADHRLRRGTAPPSGGAARGTRAGAEETRGTLRAGGV